MASLFGPGFDSPQVHFLFFINTIIKKGNYGNSSQL